MEQAGQPSKWVYEKAPAKKESGFDFAGFTSGLVTAILMYGYATLLPLVVLTAVDWGAWLLLQETFYEEPWVKPGVLLLSVFLAGAFARVTMKVHQQTMLLFIVGILGITSFAVLTWYDIASDDIVFSVRLLPQGFRMSLLPFVYSIPAVGIMGMMFYSLFEIKRSQ